MKTIWDEPLRREILGRIDRVTDSATARWGKMSVAAMLAHLVESMRMATGELVIPSKKMILRHWPLNKLLIYYLPFPKGAPTAPELLRSDPGEVAVNRADLNKRIEQFASLPDDATFNEHPAFGVLSREAWGVLSYRHIDHHLKQFGV